MNNGYANKLNAETIISESEFTLYGISIELTDTPTIQATPAPTLPPRRHPTPRPAPSKFLARTTGRIILI